MLSDDELPPLPPMRCTAIPGPRAYINWFSADQMREYARAVERAAYERAKQACMEIGKEIVCPEECAAAIDALGRQHD